MNRKFIALCLGMAIVVSLASCRSQPVQEDSPSDVQQVEPVNTEPTEIKPEEPKPEPMEVADEVEPLKEETPIEEPKADGEIDPFTEVNEVVYATGTVNLRTGPGTIFDKVGSLNTGNSATRTGIGTGDADGWSRVIIDSGETVYVSSKYLSTSKPVVQQPKPSVTVNNDESAPVQTPEEISAADQAALDAILAARGLTKEQAAELGGHISDEEQRAMTSNGFEANYW